MGEQTEKGFDFNKDAGLFVCPAGHLANRKSKKSDSHPGASARMVYFLTLKNVRSVHPEKDVLKKVQKLKLILLPFQRNI